MISPGSPEAVAPPRSSRTQATSSLEVPKPWIEKYVNPEIVLQSVENGTEPVSAALFIQKMKSGDELALFISPDYSLEDKLGSRGYIQLRNGVQVDSYTLPNYE